MFLLFQSRMLLHGRVPVFEKKPPKTQRGSVIKAMLVFVDNIKNKIDTSNLKTWFTCTDMETFALGYLSLPLELQLCKTAWYRLMVVYYKCTLHLACCLSYTFIITLGCDSAEQTISAAAKRIHSFCRYPFQFIHPRMFSFAQISFLF